MNCKPGDMARVISSAEMQRCGFVDRIVTCESECETVGGGPGWNISPSLKCQCCGEICTGLADRVLRPIRNDPGADETLSWVDVPSAVEQPS